MLTLFRDVRFSRYARTKAAVCISSYFANTQNIVFALTVHLLLICTPFLVFFFPGGKATGA
jgi:hypothetical protein